jgi:hypothetical protein
MPGCSAEFFQRMCSENVLSAQRISLYSMCSPQACQVSKVTKYSRRKGDLPTLACVCVCVCVCGPEGVDALGGFREVNAEDENARNVGVGAGSLKLDTNSDKVSAVVYCLYKVTV